MFHKFNEQDDSCEVIEPLQRVALLLEYDGSVYHGSQMQPDRMTVQGALQEALEALNVNASGMALSGRTDAGVHARGQVAHFEMPLKQFKLFHHFLRSLNSKLPSTVRVKQFFPVSQQFHSRRNSTHKWYRFKIYNASEQSVWMPNDAIWVRKPLDVQKMNEAIKLVLGTHDFKSFKCPPKENI